MANLQAEKLLLSGFVKYPDCFFDLFEYLDINQDFFYAGTRSVFSVICNLYINQDARDITKDKIFSTAIALSIQNFNSLTNNGTLVDDILSEPIEKLEVVNYFEEVKRKSYIYQVKDATDEIRNYLGATDDSLVDVISKVESDICGVGQNIGNKDDVVIDLGKDIWKYIDELADNPGNLGIDLGYPCWQSQIGQIRNGGITFLAATSKWGKSQFSLNAAFKAAHKLHLPVFVVDTEMNEKDQYIRLVGQAAKIPYNIIESGLWKMSKSQLSKLDLSGGKITEILEYGRRMNDVRFREIVRDLPIKYMAAAGSPMTSVIPRIKRWLLTTVKPNPDATMPQCLLIYDYFKLATFDELKDGKLQEYQLHGLNIGALHSFCKKMNIPCLGFGQTNNEIGDNFRSIAGSKRIIENCTSITLMKRKTDDELRNDPNGNSLFRTLGSRFGNNEDSHINFRTTLQYGQFEELGVGNFNGQNTAQNNS